MPKPSSVCLNAQAAKAPTQPTTPTSPPPNAALSPEQQAAYTQQSQSHFAQTVLLNPVEDCWNHV